MSGMIHFTHKRYSDAITAITAPMGEQIYLVEGLERALVIDTGMGIGSLARYIGQLTKLPILVVNTHGHPDHAGGNSEFTEVLLHTADRQIYEEMCSKTYRSKDICKALGGETPEFKQALLPFAAETKPLNCGQILNLGGRSLEVIGIEGHTWGSVCLYDAQSRSLFAGDSIANEVTWMHLAHSAPLQRYYNALRSLSERKLAIDRIFTGHGSEPKPTSNLFGEMMCARAILLRNIEGEPTETFAGVGMKCYCYDSSIIYNPLNLYEM